MRPLPTINLDGKEYFYGYKVVTDGLMSLGLRRNPHILEYPVGEWFFLPEDWVVEGKEDFGGIWVCRKKSGASTLQKYMASQYSQETRCFKAAVDQILYENSYRIKTNGILLLEEILGE